MAKLTVDGEIDADSVVKRVRELGYDVADPDEAAAPAQALPNFFGYLLTGRDTRLALLGGLLILPGLIFNEFLPMLGIQHWLFDATSILAMMVAGFPSPAAPGPA